MTNPPFGFNPPGSNDPDDGSGNQPAQPPFGMGFGGFGAMPGGVPGDLSGLMPMLQQLQQMLSGGGSGPVNWELAKQSAVHAAQASQKPTTTTVSDVAQAVHIADLWLNEATSFPSGISSAEAWTRTEWISRTLPVWSQLCDPVAAKLADAMTALMPSDAQEMLAGLPAMPGLDQMMRQMGGMMFGGQFGQALAHLSREVLTSTDIGLPLGPDGVAVLITQNIEELASGLEHDAGEVRLYLALREAAYVRLFMHVPWLKGKLLSTIETYAAGITIDKDAVEREIAELNPEDLQSNPQKIQEVISSGIFEPQRTAAQQQQLEALETLLALIEGWVDRVVSVASHSRLPSAESLAEMMRRRRAVGGPAEQTFSTLVGLQLRPRRLREAAARWEEIEAEKGAEGRDRLWDHPDLLPTAADFAPPSDEEPAELSFTDADLEAWLSAESDGTAPDGGSAADGDTQAGGADDGSSGSDDGPASPNRG